MQSQNEVEIEEFVRRVLSVIVSRPDEIQIERIVTADGSGELPLLELRITVSPEDAGQAIGKQGRTARSLRTIVGAMANRRNIRVAINLCNTTKVGQELSLAAAD